MNASTAHKKPAIVLLSGGLDSATVLAVAKTDGFTPHCLSFRYGQRHEQELACAAAVARAAGVEPSRHVIATIDLSIFGGSALTDTKIAVPKDTGLVSRVSGAGSDADSRNPKPEPRNPSAIPITYVPARNTIFLAFALAFAETRGASDIYIGVNALDYSGYPDCRPEFVRSFEQTANLATKAGVEGQAIRIRTPLIDLTKAQIIKLGLSLGVDYSLTFSCYDPIDNRPCGHCDACALRLRGFAEAGASDPLQYATTR
jgi:7-cyano-7-deazaguanine synthase